MKAKKKNFIKLIGGIIFLVVAVLIIGIILGWFNKEDIKEKIDKLTPNGNEEKKSNIKIIDESSNARPIAVMIDNVSAARPQTGIEKAHILYEFLVEGGLTRLMAVFKDVNVKQIGPVRSSRHYYLDYVMENDAIYVHYGWSPQAQSDISSLKINNLNGLANPSNMFWRDYTYHSGEHTAYTSTEKILKAAEAKKYRTTSNDSQLLKYSEEAISMPENVANEVKVVFSNSVYTKFTYDETNNVYLRSANSSAHKTTSGNQLAAKNIIVYSVEYDKIPKDTSGRQNMFNIGSGSGYFITEGKYMEITWEKSKRDSKTIYKDADGKEISVNDGTTHILINPKGQKITIS